MSTKQETTEQTTAYRFSKWRGLVFGYKDFPDMISDPFTSSQEAKEWCEGFQPKAWKTEVVRIVS